ncbi:MAG: ferritin-like domain-containing protein [Aquihabitans sp.]
MTTLPHKNVKYQEETRVPIDKPNAQVDTTNRRTFLTRAAMGGALVAVGTVGPLGRLLPVAAQDGGSPEEPADGKLDDNAAGETLAPIELAAVKAYEAALADGKLDSDWSAVGRQFQRHHLVAADALTGLIDSGATPVADPTIQLGTVAAISGTSDQQTILDALSEMETAIAATHLWALESVTDKITAKTIGQFLAVESQQAVFLARDSAGDLAALTPAVVEPATSGPTPAPTTTEETGN